MNYYNWQKIHKAAHASKTQTKKTADPALSIEIVHMRAWAELNRICFREELVKLLKLAEQYDNGERLPDTAYLSQQV
jgi:hypothetical protein